MTTPLSPAELRERTPVSAPEEPQRAPVYGPCPNCDGRGYHEWFVAADRTDGEPCWTCAGTGEVEFEE